MKRSAVLVTALAGLMLVFGLAGTVLAATKTVKLTVDNQFTPASTTVAVGDTVEFVWDGGFHDVSFADGVNSGTPVGDVGTKYSRTFNEAGTFAYVCTVHEALGMKGTVTVTAAGGGGGGSAGGGGSQALPLTGPEDSILPLAGLLLALVGAVVFVRTLRSR